MTMEEIIQKLTLEEKAVLLQGQSSWTTWDIPRILLPSIFLADGPHGLRKQAGSADHLGLNESIPATCFPTAATMANAWDPALGEELGRAIGEEAAAQGVNVVLGPGLNIKRSPLCGRNFEYFSEDPYLSGKMAAGYIRGIQSQGVAACPKHFAANSQEHCRMSVDSVVDERTLREIYLTGFEIAVKEARPRAIMSAYNPVNGTYATENPHLLKEILREEWGFEGFVVSDWGACSDPVAAVAAGAALNMPNPGFDCAQILCDAVRDGTLAESALDDRLRELLSVVLNAQKETPDFDENAHHALAKKCAAESIVLLENDGILPLAKGTKVALIGDFAKTPRYQGAGSSQVNPTQVEDLFSCLTELDITYARGFRRDGKKAEKLLREAVAAANNAETVVLCVGLDELAETEGRDRDHLELPETQQTLIDALCRANKNVVLVLCGGAPFRVPRGCRAVIHGYLGGQAGAAAMADALLGRINPSGHLAETWPENLEDTPCHRYYPGREKTAEYREGLFVGYRYYETVDKPVRYPFGHGLSYTNFTYSDLEADSRSVRVTITNSGERDGATVAQVYIQKRTGKVFVPKKELKGFQKIFLKAGESRRITIELDDKAFRYFNIKTQKWEMETAHYAIFVGENVGDSRLSTTLRLIGTDAPSPYKGLPSYESGTVTNVPDYEFAALLDRPIPERQRGELSFNDPLWRLKDAKTGAARWLYRRLIRRVETSKKPNLNDLFILNMPFRALAQMTKGRISRAMAEDIRYWADGHFWTGLGRLIRGWFRARKIDRHYRKELDYGPRDY
ncbi:MAG: glycoside hydrolase family 3 C-terminal domain-containing protein [Oscillospiraceae bacterium]|nr:glycoside hydrolase family 3 C-terminal domain-containing protein [Oscillospiraceae bacterium]